MEIAGPVQVGAQCRGNLALGARRALARTLQFDAGRMDATRYHAAGRRTGQTKKFLETFLSGAHFVAGDFADFGLGE